MIILSSGKNKNVQLKANFSYGLHKICNRWIGPLARKRADSERKREREIEHTFTNCMRVQKYEHQQRIKT